MEIQLIKKHKLNIKEMPKGSIFSVDLTTGLDLIEKGIAIDVTKRVETEQEKAQEEETKKAIEIIKAYKEVEQQEEIKNLLDLWIEEISKKFNKQNISFTSTPSSKLNLPEFLITRWKILAEIKK